MTLSKLDFSLDFYCIRYLLVVRDIKTMPNRPTFDDDDDEPAILNSRRALQDIDDGASLPGMRMAEHRTSPSPSPPPLPINIKSFAPSKYHDDDDDPLKPETNVTTTTLAVGMNGFEVSLLSSTTDDTNGDLHKDEPSPPLTSVTEVTGDSASLDSDSDPVPRATPSILPEPSSDLQQPQPPRLPYFPPPPSSTFLGDGAQPPAPAQDPIAGNYLIDILRQRSSDLYKSLASAVEFPFQQEQVEPSTNVVDEEQPQDQTIPSLHSGFDLIDHLRQQNQIEVDSGEEKPVPPQPHEQVPPQEPNRFGSAVSVAASTATNSSSVGGGGASISMMHTSIAMMHMSRVDDGANTVISSTSHNSGSLSRGVSVTFSTTSDNSRRQRSSGRSRYHQRRVMEEPPSPPSSRNAKSGDGEESKEEIHTQDSSSFKSGLGSSRNSSSQRKFPLSNFQTFSPTQTGGGAGGGDDESLTDEDDIVDDLDGDAGSIVSEATAEASNRSGSVKSGVSGRSGFSGSLRSGISGRSGYSGRSRGSSRRGRMGRYRQPRRHGSRRRHGDDDDQTDASSQHSGKDDDDQSVVSTASSVASKHRKFNEQFQRMVERMAQRDIEASEAIQERRKQGGDGVDGKNNPNVYVSYLVIFLFILAPILGRLVWKSAL